MIDKTVSYVPRKQTIVPPIAALQWQCGHCQTRNWAEDLVCATCEGALPTIVSFTASHMTITLGQAIRLAWEVEDALSVQVLPDEEIATPSGMMDVYPPATTQYRLIARNAIGTIEASLTLRLPAPKIVSFETAEEEIQVDYPTIFHWEVENGAEIFIDRGVGNVSGRSFWEQKLAEPGRYTLTVRNPSGEAQANVTLRLPLPEIGAFYAGSELIRLNQGNWLHWEVANASKVEVFPDIGEIASGTTLEVFPDRTTQYTLRATNFSGTVEKSLTLTLPPPRIHYFEGNSPISTEGAPVELRWEVEHAYQIEILPDIGKVPASGSRKIRPQQAYTHFYLVASGHSGRAEASFMVTLFPLPLEALAMAGEPESAMDMDLNNQKLEQALPDLKDLEKEITRTNDEFVQELTIRRALEMELTDELLALEKASIRSEIRNLIRKLKLKLNSKKS